LKGSLDKDLTKIAEIVASQSDNGETAAHNELSLATEGLIMYLKSQVHGSAFFGYSGIYGSGFGHGTDENAKNDIINLVKTEIRSVKGAVLNMYGPIKGSLFANVVCSRNFPAPSAGLRVA
jgi:hypothetical protein